MLDAAALLAAAPSAPGTAALPGTALLLPGTPPTGEAAPVPDPFARMLKALAPPAAADGDAAAVASDDTDLPDTDPARDPANDLASAIDAGIGAVLAFAAPQTPVRTAAAPAEATAAAAPAKVAAIPTPAAPGIALPTADASPQPVADPAAVPPVTPTATPGPEGRAAAQAAASALLADAPRADARRSEAPVPIAATRSSTGSAAAPATPTAIAKPDGDAPASAGPATPALARPAIDATLPGPPAPDAQAATVAPPLAEAASPAPAGTPRPAPAVRADIPIDETAARPATPAAVVAAPATPERAPAPRRVTRPSAVGDVAPPPLAAAVSPIDRTTTAQASTDISGPAAASATPRLAPVLDMAHETAWLDQLARDIARSAAREGELKFKLNPEHLGALKVELSAGAQGTAVRMTADTDAARAILVDAQPRLVAEARAQGLRISESHVDLGGGRGDAWNGAGTQNQQRQPASGDRQPFAVTHGQASAERPESPRRSAERYA